MGADGGGAAVEAFVVTGLPEGLSAHHKPYVSVRSWPLAVPGPESALNVYRGQPPYVTRTSPEGLLTVPSREAWTPVPAMPDDIPEGTTTAGHTAVHPPVAVQVTLPPFSDARTYSVRPFPSTSTVPTPGTLAAFTVTEALDALDPPDVVVEPAAAGATVPVDVGVVDALLDDPHAAKRMAAPVTTTMGQANAPWWLERTEGVILASKGLRCFILV